MRFALLNPIGSKPIQQIWELTEIATKHAIPTSPQFSESKVYTEGVPLCGEDGTWV